MMQERRGHGTEAKLCNLTNQLEELLLLLQEASKVTWSQSPQSDNVMETMEPERREAAKPLQAEADVFQASSEGRKECDRPGNESEKRGDDML